ncbi:MAG: WG repeat-containing protein [Oscillospiraceae bacterium]|nr:WG repeat-containing protein [Oscillospiraceae bacterium]
MKKMLAFVSALCMLSLSVPVQGFAEETAEIDVSAQVQEADRLNTDYSVSMKKLDVQSATVGSIGKGYAVVESGDFGAIIDKDGNITYTAKAGEIEIWNRITGSDVLSDTCGFRSYSPTDNVTWRNLDKAGKQLSSYRLPDGTLLAGNYDYGSIMNDGVAVVANVVDEPGKSVDYRDEETGEEYGDEYEKYLQAFIINSDGEVLYTFPEGCYFMNSYTDTYEDENGETQTETSYYYTNWMGFGMPSEGLIGFGTVEEPENSALWNGCCGYMDYEGNIVIPQNFSNVGAFSEGLAWAEYGGGTGHDYGLGYINKSGEVVIPFGKYWSVSIFKNGLACVAVDTYEEPTEEETTEEGTLGHTHISTWHEAIPKYGYINKNDETVIPCEYDDLQGTFDGDYVYAQKDGKYGYINQKNETVIPFEYDDAGYTAGDLFPVQKDGKYGLVDKNNQIVIPMIFDDIADYENDGIIFAVQDNQVYSFEITPEAEQTSSETEDFLPGDADSNGKVDILDVITLNKAIMGKENLTDTQIKTIDFNQNGKPDSEESLTLLKYIVGLITDLTA